MKCCVTCGDALHPERAEKYDYCTKPECQRKNLKDLTIVSVGVNKSADQFMILDDQTTEDLANGRHHDQRRTTYGKVDHTTTPATPTPTAKPAPATPTPTAKPTTDQPAPTRRPPWTDRQQRLAVLYNEQGLTPDQIARKLGLTRYTVTQMILTAPRRPHR